MPKLRQSEIELVGQEETNRAWAIVHHAEMQKGRHSVSSQMPLMFCIGVVSRKENRLVWIWNKQKL